MLLRVDLVPSSLIWGTVFNIHTIHLHFKIHSSIQFTSVNLSTHLLMHVHIFTHTFLHTEHALNSFQWLPFCKKSFAQASIYKYLIISSLICHFKHLNYHHAFDYLRVNNLCPVIEFLLFTQSKVHCCAKVAEHLFLAIQIKLLIYKIHNNEFFS